ncbi:hypothetical protein HHK36_011257 [Tetracentron sinense]|uniref:Late embryogenesis abundant protein LEA-2 subgroup domain-containing protein n=1 Tax=Tetracentron sinense TaxID=13715 RepID=A0A834Z9V9_TETSI|nr:hypothetical protein HHK36_011257 [Tetracentron sinense]
MARPAAPRSRQGGLIRCIAIMVLVTIILFGLIILIIWLEVRPKLLTFTVEESSVHGFHLEKNHINGTFRFSMKSYNPNSKVSVYYNSMNVYVVYDEQTIAFSDAVVPFFQPRHNGTQFVVKPVAQPVLLMGSVSRDLRLEEKTGDIEVAVKVKANIRFRLGIWKSSERTLRVFCSSVVVHISSAKNFERSYCDVHL